MHETDGALALKSRPQSARSRRPVQKPSPIRTKRVPVTATPSPEMATWMHARTVRRTLTRQRIRLLCSIVLLVFLVTGIFAMVVYRQAMILEANFQNLRVERQLLLKNQEISQIRESLAQKTNLDEIRRQAIGRLGLQDPARSQIITVAVPDSDRVVFAAPVAASADDEAYLASAYTTIEGYFKTLTISGQGN